MSNLGFYQTITTIIKKSGGPKNFIGYFIMASTAALGAVGTLGYKLGQKNEKSKSIDRVSNTFGNLMGEIFVFKKDEYEQTLRNIGFNLGKYIYILDAYEDLEEDYKNKRYNPFIDYIDKKEELKNKVDRLISMSLGMVAKNIENLNLEFNKAIIDNIIYSGVYLRYKHILEEGCETNVQ